MDAFLVDYIRTPIGRYGGSLSTIRPDDLGSHVLRTLLERNGDMPAAKIDEVIMGCANQAGEDNRNVARMAALLAGLPDTVPALTVNRLCASGLAAVNIAANKIKTGEADLMIAGGVESMTRAPFIMPKPEQAFSRAASVEDTTIGWRMVNPRMKAEFGIDSMPETAENVAEDFDISRADQDAFAFRSQERAAKAQSSGRFAKEIVPVTIPQRRGEDILFDRDEHPREASLEKLSKLRALFRQGGSVTAGNASGVNDGAAATLIASAAACKAYGLKPRARILGGASAGVTPRVMGIGPVPAVQKLLARLDKSIEAFDVIELNEAFASQSLAVLRQLGLSDDAENVNPNGGAIALGHPLGMSGTRLIGTALIELEERDARLALATMCVGVGQGEALAIERITE
ncbi:3-oxoadipyl-CoA thiolase [Sulfitobacter sp. KE34]|uniref:3-oxoadipyl-CoA thiolase n=1 Tax=unclassified Sulfitobacter TaxID=196795 RepID=UPI001445E179|nr:MULTISPECIES: 3-oxoadipyl-CoA thiolase [unclassified Sulfitobacter]NKX40263.1 3-oxoadipyl-CoA thiolase [Rhodobacteraceae bacterium R_SAG2]MDF3351635.1 3-oxoadipyl-CoA thiolase [Sulfitobacter sp. KE12]MDF3355308.1 3-oxoadipyl-CoA thiolase [Sulfitobacter sp. KE27]MDF3358956.1 3-oxoadipyl-CoA thiolase [Sulfitobacter sp. KE33]MDF3366380.1 3-oxoadipyl-CoA thiolase [Sulfitobacter sp. Ks34]